MGIRQSLIGFDATNQNAEPKPRGWYPKSRRRGFNPPEERSLPAGAGDVRPTPSSGLFRRSGWAVLVYALVLISALGIASVAYTTYAFSKYQGLILPGVYVDTVSLGSEPKSVAGEQVVYRLSVLKGVPLVLTFGQQKWQPTQRQLGLEYDYNTTIDNAFSIGRTGNFWEDLFDRLPIRRHFSVRLIARMRQPLVNAWVDHALVQVIHRRMSNAGLTMQGDRVTVIRSTDGYHVDVPATLGVINHTIGKLSMHRIPVPITYIYPRITDAQAGSLATRIDNFLKNPPVLRVGHDLVPTSRTELASMISFTPTISASGSSIAMNIDNAALGSYVSTVAAAYDRQAQDPQSLYANGQVTVVSPEIIGRSMDQAAATARLLAAFTGLQPNQTIAVPVTKIQPPADPTNPALDGVTTELAQAQTEFVGAPASRGTAVAQIAAKLNNQLIPPGSVISFNSYVQTFWPQSVYGDSETTVSGQVVPGADGAMQQVATTFLRAAYYTGLPIVEWHPHTYLLPWYEPPAGLDAVVSPSGSDLRFLNNTGGYLLIQSAVDQSGQTVTIYIYGRGTGWTVNVSPPRLIGTHPHGAPVVQSDPSLPQGVSRVVQYPHDGADYVVLRTVRKPHSKPATDTATTHYQASSKVVQVGLAAPTPTPQTPEPTPTPIPTQPLTPIPTSTPTIVVPSPTPTSTLAP